MKISFKLYTAYKITTGDYPIKMIIHFNGKIKRINTGMYSKKSHWNFNTQMPVTSSPDYDLIYPKLLNYRNTAKQLIADNIMDLNKIINEVFGQKKQTMLFSDFAMLIVAEKIKNKSFSYADLITNVVNIVGVFDPTIMLNKIDYNWLMRFRNYKESTVKRSTMHNYLRTMRTIYNEAVRRGVIDDKQPFKNVFNGLTVRSNRTRKKFIKINDIIKLEKAELSKMMEVARDLWLLQFYFGGQDLMDIYYLEKKQIHNNRIFFNRAKLAGKGYEFDLFIPKKAQKILDKYTNDTDYLFEFNKDHKYYEQFRRRYRRSLILVQKKLNITVEPRGDNLSIKVARHTFANRGKRLFIEEDILRELMGHERDDIDNYYKDRYPEEVRDAAQIKIINPSV